MISEPQTLFPPEAIQSSVEFSLLAKDGKCRTVFIFYLRHVSIPNALSCYSSYDEFQNRTLQAILTNKLEMGPLPLQSWLDLLPLMDSLPSLKVNNFQFICEFSIFNIFVVVNGDSIVGDTTNLINSLEWNH